MMPGIVASSGARAADSGGWLPSGATFHLDFVNGNYYAGGREQSVLDLLGGGFDAAQIGAQGMNTEPGSGNQPAAIGDLLADYLALWASGLTVIAEVEKTVAAGTAMTGTFVSFMDGSDAGSVAASAAGFLDTGDIAVADFGSLSSFDPGFDPIAAAQGIHRLGFTLYRDLGGGSYESATSHNGSAAVTATTGYNGPGLFTAAYVPVCWDFGDFWYDALNARIRSLTGYPALTPAELAVLTASS